MNRLLFHTDRLRNLVAMLAGVTLALAFPQSGVAGLAWIAPGGILAAAFGTSGRRTFRIGWFAGFAYSLTSLYWLLNIPVMKLAPIVGWLALSAYVALYTGLWTWFCWLTWPASRADPSESWSAQLQRFATSGWWVRTNWTIRCASAWVALEIIRSRLLTGFPWNPLGASQGKLVPLMQLAAFTGPYGISFLVAWFSTALMCTAALFVAGGRAMRFAKLEIVVPLLATIGVLAWGLRLTMEPDQPAMPTVKLALIQPAIPQTAIWDPVASSNSFEHVLELSEAALQSKPDVLIWPEGVVPGYARWDPPVYNSITNFVRRHGVWLILNASDARPAREPEAAGDIDSFNAAFLVSPEGEFIATYHKRRLVIFGEYIPLSRWLPFLTRWTGMGNYAEGDGPVEFAAAGLRFKTSVLICFEDMFPHHVRQYAGDEMDFLLNLTNDGWFGNSSMQWQHAAFAAFRAVENGLPLVRCANNGLTCWIDARGRKHDVQFASGADLHAAGFKIAEVPLSGGGARSATYYRRHGDAFGWACVLFSTLTGIVSVRNHRRRQSGIT